MPIKIKVGPEGQKTKRDKEMQGQGEDTPDISMEFVIRKTLSGNYMIKDHIDMNVMVIPSEGKVITMPKDKSFDSDVVYGSQSRLMQYLKERGVIDHDSIEGSDGFGTLEATFPESGVDNVDAIQMVIFTIAKFMEDEEPYMTFSEKHDAEWEEHRTDPDDEHSTELGEVPQGPEKGSMEDSTFPYGAYFTHWY